MYAGQPLIVVMQFRPDSIWWCVPNENGLHTQVVNADFVNKNVLPMRLPGSDVNMGTFRATLQELIIDRTGMTGSQMVDLADRLNFKWNPQ